MGFHLVSGWMPSHALTLMQPWASALFFGRPVESRKRKDGRCPYPQIKPGWLAIHAGQGVHGWADQAYASLPSLPPLEQLPRGAILGKIFALEWLTARRAAEIPALAPWVFPADPDRWYLHHDVERAELFSEPVRCDGAQGVRRTEPRLARAA